ncbi:hypothetical protein C8R44DRAFT_984368 [Mycena epipterygia]|nr:hypothetical protein C8R44DRAFT_984368 [Mycena epipterygia]
MAGTWMDGWLSRESGARMQIDACICSTCPVHGHLGIRVIHNADDRLITIPAPTPSFVPHVQDAAIWSPPALRGFFLLPSLVHQHALRFRAAPFPYDSICPFYVSSPAPYPRLVLNLIPSLAISDYMSIARAIPETK